MRNWLKTTYSIVAIVSLLGVTSSVHGVAAFARQTGLDCTSCHASTGYPALNAFGRAFKAGAYSQASEDMLLGDGETLSMPDDLGFGVVFKAKTKHAFNSDGSVENEFAIPDETAVFAAGRIAPNVGFAIELNDAWWNSFKVVFAPEVGPVRLGFSVWGTDGFGPAWSFESLNTGGVRNIRIIEDRKLISAAAALDFGNVGENAGLGFYVWHPMANLAYTAFTRLDTATLDGFAHYVKAAATPSFGPIDLGVGVSYTFGDAKGNAETAFNENYNFLVVDLQVYGDLGLPLALLVTYANDMNATSSVMGVALDAAVVPDTFNITLGARIALDANNSTAIGGDFRYQLFRNVRLALGWDYNITDSAFHVSPLVFGSW